MGKEPARVWNSDAYKKELQETARSREKLSANRQRGRSLLEGREIIEASIRADAGACVDGTAGGLAVYRDGRMEVWAPSQIHRDAECDSRRPWA